MLEVRRLCISYGGLAAVDDVSLTVGTGEIVAIVGMNGAGKTSILNAVSGIHRPERGKSCSRESRSEAWLRMPSLDAASCRCRKDG